MPLRSVEAATRDDAIAAAREQFGASARVVGVRRVRSGGVLGFFATERYVAEVDPDRPARPAVPVPAPARPSSGEARVQAPARARVDRAVEERRPALSDDDRVAELAGLLGGGPPVRAHTPAPRRAARPDVAPQAPARLPARDPFAEREAARGSAPEPVRPAVVRGESARPAPPAPVGEAAGRPAPEQPAPGSAATPSPFTAALARMVSGDREVRQAVEEALAEPTGALATAPADPWSAWSGPDRATEASVRSRATHQEEEPVELQDHTSSRAPASVEPPAAAPAWGTAPGWSRQEEVAEALRAALAQDRADEALAGILRRTMDGASPQTPPAVIAVLEEPVPEEPVAEEPVLEEPVVERPAVDEPAAEVLSPALPGGSGLGWDDDQYSSLWAETAAPAEAVAEPVGEPVHVLADEAVAERATAEDVVVGREVTGAEGAADVPDMVTPVLARTASDPAPMTFDATTVMPPLSLLPPLPSSRRRGGRPPVPVAVDRGPAAPVRAPQPPADAPSTPDQDEALATVTRLPSAARDETPAAAPAVHAAQDTATGTPAAADADVVTRLTAMGLPAALLDDSFGADAAIRGTYAALTRALATGLPRLPEFPAGAGEVLVVVGPGVETLRAARALAASLRLDPDRVQWASRGDLAALAPESSRMATIEAAIDRREDAAGAGTVTIVAVDAPLRTDAYWTAQMLAIWTPGAVWAVVEATRKPEDLEPWLDGLPRVDALMVSDCDLSADPAAVLGSVALPRRLPVATLDGILATPHRWASLLCERLETPRP